MATSKAPRVVLGKPPATIHRVVETFLPTGEPCSIPIDYVYRRRDEYGQLLDARLQAARAADAQREAASAAAVAAGDEPAPPLTAAEIQRMSVDATADHILDIASGWGLPEPFDLAHVTQLCNELPGVASAIVDDYRAAIIEGRRGN